MEQGGDKINEKTDFDFVLFIRVRHGADSTESSGAAKMRADE